MSSVKDQILDLYPRCEGVMPRHKITKFIAERLGTTDSYVRTVARQRMGSYASQSELRYLSSPLGKAKSRRQSVNRWARIKADPKKLDAINAARRHRRARDRASVEARP